MKFISAPSESTLRRNTLGIYTLVKFPQFLAQEENDMNLPIPDANSIMGEHQSVLFHPRIGTRQPAELNGVKGENNFSNVLCYQITSPI